MNFNITKFRHSKSKLYESKYNTIRNNFNEPSDNNSFYESNNMNLFKKDFLDTNSEKNNINPIIIQKNIPLYFEEKISLNQAINKHTNNLNEGSIENTNAHNYDQNNNLCISTSIQKNISITQIKINNNELSKDKYIYYPNEGILYLFININDGIFYENIFQVVFFIQLICNNIVNNSCLNKPIQTRYYYRGYYKYH